MGAPTFDGTSDAPSRGGSQAPSARVSGSNRTPSIAGAASGPAGYPAPLGFDPAREKRPQAPEEAHRTTVSKRVDLPPDAFVEVCAARY